MGTSQEAEALKPLRAEKNKKSTILSTIEERRPRQLEPALPITLFHHEEQGGLGTDVDAETDRTGADAGSEGEGEALR